MAQFWSEPEGTRCEKKTWVTTQIGAAIGFVTSLYNVTLFPPPSVLNGVQKTAALTLTLATVGAVFGVTTCTTAKLRDNPDHPMNYFAGGCAAGTIFGVRTHSATIGAGTCVSLGIVAFVAKYGQNEGWKWFP